MLPTVILMPRLNSPQPESYSGGEWTSQFPGVSSLFLSHGFMAPFAPGGPTGPLGVLGGSAALPVLGALRSGSPRSRLGLACLAGLWLGLGLAGFS